MRGTAEIFATPPGRAFFSKLTGGDKPSAGTALRVQVPAHPWVKHLEIKKGVDASPLRPGYLDAKATILVSARKGGRIIGNDNGSCTLYRVRIGKGQLIYLGWEIAAALPATRSKASTLEQEQRYEDEMRILSNIIAELFPKSFAVSNESRMP
jgi:hypothetical protein